MKLFNMFVMSLLFSLVGCKNSQVSIEDKERFEFAINQGNIIISAVNRYMSEKNHYPNNLLLLVPEYMKSIPETDTGKPFGYMKFENVIGYDGPPGFNLSFRLSGGSFFGNTNSYFLFSNDKKYEDTDKRKTHFVIDDWAYVTSFRHKVGESGRVE